MEKHLDTKKCLRAFATVSQKGDRTEKGYAYEGLLAESLDDGYTIMLSDSRCVLTLFFHNKFTLSGPDSKSEEQFVRRVYRVAEE